MKIFNYFTPFVLFFFSCNEKISYPKTKKIDHVDTYYETKVQDPYRWLEDDMSDETGDWVQRQNKVTFK